MINERLNMQIFNTYQFIGETAGMGLFTFLAIWVMAYSSKKENSKHLFVSIGIGSSLTISLLFAFLLQIKLNGTGTNPIGYLNPGILFGHTLSQTFVKGANLSLLWGHFGVWLGAEIVGAIIGGVLGMFSTRYLFRKEEIKKEFQSLGKFQYRNSYLFSEIVTMFLFTISLLGWIYYSNSNVLTILFVGFSLFTIILLFNQKYSASLNSAIALGVAVSRRIYFGKNIAESCIIKNSWSIIIPFVGSGLAGLLIGLVQM